MAEEALNMTSEEHLQTLRDNPPVKPNQEELDEVQYESAKASYDRAVELWEAEIQKVEAGIANPELLTEEG